MVPGAKTGKRSTVLIVLTLLGGLILIAGLVEIVDGIAPAPEPPAASSEAPEAAPRVVPQVQKVDDHTVEISFGMFHRSTIRLSEAEQIDPLVDCILAGIERLEGERESGEESASRQSWLFLDPESRRMREAVQRVQTECIGVNVPRLSAWPATRQRPPAASDPGEEGGQAAGVVTEDQLEEFEEYVRVRSLSTESSPPSSKGGSESTDRP